MTSSDDRRTLLSKHQARVLCNYERILDMVALNPDRVLEHVKSDPVAIIPILRSMTDQAVRSEVIFTYTMIDMELEHTVLGHFFGTGKKLHAARRTQCYRTLRFMLQNTYLMQKLTIVGTFKDIPKAIRNSIAKINDLRNGLAHTFFVSDLSKPKRTYNGQNIFTRKGLEAFQKDAWEIRYFFMPWLKKFIEEDGDSVT